MLPLYHHALPQLSGSLFLTDAGLETDLVFNRGIAIPALNLSTRLTGEAEPGADATMVYTLTSTANRTAGFAPELASGAAVARLRQRKRRAGER